MNNTKTKTKSYLFAAIGFLLTLALDQWTKYLASTILRRLESFSLISGVFELRYLENRGAAFGIMQNRQIVFVVGGIIILAVILYLYQKKMCIRDSTHMNRMLMTLLSFVIFITFRSQQISQLLKH